MVERPDLSVVIPTRDRRAKLHETLTALVEQKDEVSLEVLVIDDGSKDDTADYLRQIEGSHPFPFRWFSHDGQGPAAARNRGTREAVADTILFLGDDTRPTPGTLRRHLELARLGTAVQGYIDWDPTREITPLMEFLAPEGPQFYFRGLRSEEKIPFTAVLGSNFSAPKEWLLDEPFDEGFPYAAVEDTEMAWRWYRIGRTAVYCRDAVCLHHHRYNDLEPFLARQRRAGISARYAVRKHPRLAWSLVIQPTVFSAWIWLRRLMGRSRAHDKWDLACRGAFISGFLSGPGKEGT